MDKVTYSKKEFQNADSTSLSIRDDFPDIPSIKKQYNARWDLHSMALTEDGMIYVVGFNREGQLGLGDRKDRKVASKIEGLPPIKDFTIGHMSSFLIDENNNVYGFGKNCYGMLGLGHEDNVLEPQEITNLRGCDITKICYWSSTAFFLSKDGTVYYSGKFDKASWFYPKTPRVFSKVHSITKIDFATHFTNFLDSSGKVHVQFSNILIGSISCEFVTSAHTNIFDIGVAGIDSYHGHAPSAQVLLDKSGQVFISAEKWILDEQLPLPKVKRMTQYVPLENEKYLANVFELYDGSFAGVKIYRNSNWDIEIAEEMIPAESKLAHQLKELMDKREIASAPIKLDTSESLLDKLDEYATALML